MARQKMVSINGVDYKLQSVSPSWYIGINDKYGMTGGKKNTVGYMDDLLKNVVVEPKEVQSNGIKYFDDADDVSSLEALFTEIEFFLRGRK